VARRRAGYSESYRFTPAPFQGSPQAKGERHKEHSPKALALTNPPAVLARANEVIQ
jgi:hypothetical protein